jgi:hypothetical protein
MAPSGFVKLVCKVLPSRKHLGLWWSQEGCAGRIGAQAGPLWEEGPIIQHKDDAQRIYVDIVTLDKD